MIINANRPGKMLGLIAVVTGSADRAAEQTTVKKCYFFLVIFFLPALAFVDFLAAFLVAISRDSCHLGFRCHFPFPGKENRLFAPPASDERGDRFSAFTGYQQLIHIVEL